MESQFELAGGSVAGTNHRRGVPTNCQDAFCISQGPWGSIAVIADGCSSGDDSEVGAAIGVRLVAYSLERHLSKGRPATASLLRRVHQETVSHLHVLAKSMGESLSEVVARYFLFTLVGVAITDENATFFSIGDGVIVVNGEEIRLLPSEENEPLYIGYALTGSRLTDDNPNALDFRIARQLPPRELESFLIGTDGVCDVIEKAEALLPGEVEPFGAVSQFWREERYFTRKVAITRRLNLMARDRFASDGAKDGGRLPDDTTLVVGRSIAKETRNA